MPSTDASALPLDVSRTTPASDSIANTTRRGLATGSARQPSPRAIADLGLVCRGNRCHSGDACADAMQTPKAAVDGEHRAPRRTRAADNGEGSRLVGLDVHARSTLAMTTIDSESGELNLRRRSRATWPSSAVAPRRSRSHRGPIRPRLACALNETGDLTAATRLLLGRPRGSLAQTAPLRAEQ